MSSRAPQLYGIPVKEIARICGVDLATARRWKRGASCPPKTALWILAGDLGCFSAEWRGWTIRGDALYSPENWQISMSDALSSPLLRAQLAAYRVENKQLKDRWDALEEQPLLTELPEMFNSRA